MSDSVSADLVVAATPAVVFAALADPSTHAAIDGTGWVRASVDGGRITAAGQVFRMAMFHEGHPEKDYETANLVIVCEEPTAIGWRTGTEDAETGELSFGGWTWRYDLAPAGDGGTSVTLTYDWSAVGPEVRSYLTFPPFPSDHLARSLAHLATIVGERTVAASS